MLSAYELLGISENATSDEIVRAYRRQMLKYHPDVNNNAQHGRTVRNLNRAKQLLTDPQKRAKYDKYLKQKRAKTAPVDSTGFTSMPDSHSKLEKGAPTSLSTELGLSFGSSQDAVTEPPPEIHKTSTPSEAIHGNRRTKGAKNVRRAIKKPPNLLVTIAGVSVGGGGGIILAILLLKFVFNSDPFNLWLDAEHQRLSQVHDATNVSENIALPPNRSDEFEAAFDTGMRGDLEDVTAKSVQIPSQPDRLLNEDSDTPIVSVGDVSPATRNGEGDSPALATSATNGHEESGKGIGDTNVPNPETGVSVTPERTEELESQDNTLPFQVLPLPAMEAVSRVRGEARELIDFVARDATNDPREVLVESFEAMSSETRPEKKLAILEEALQYSIEIAQPQLAFDILAVIASTFESDGGARSLSAIRELLANMPSEVDATEILEQLVTVAVTSLRSHDYDAASEAARYGVRSSQKLELSELKLTFADIGRRANSGKQMVSLGKESLNLLQTQNPDPDLSVTAGIYLLYIQCDLERGFGLLKDGADRNLAKIATMELNLPIDVSTKLELAKNWYEAQDAVQGNFKSWCLSRSSHWYSAVLPTLSGIERSLALKRIQEAGESNLFVGTEKDLLSPSVRRQVTNGTVDDKLGVLHLHNYEQSSCDFQIRSPSQYDLEIEFTRTPGEWGFSVFYTVRRNPVAWCYSGNRSPSLHSLGYAQERSPTVIPGYVLPDGQMNRLLIEVRNDHVKTVLNDVNIQEVANPFPSAHSDLTRFYVTRANPSIGFKAVNHWSDVTIHSMKLKPYY